MAISYRLMLLTLLICLQESFQEEIANPHTSTTPEPLESEANRHNIEGSSETSVALSPFDWTSQTGYISESRRRRRPEKGWGAFAPVLLAASTILPLLLTGLAALAGKALMSSILALAVAGFNLFRSTQTVQNNGF